MPTKGKDWRRNRYTEEEKRYAVAILKEYDELHVTQEGYEAVRRQLGNVGKPSLTSWMHEFGRTTHPLSVVITRRDRFEHVQEQISTLRDEIVAKGGENLMGEAYAIGLEKLADPASWKGESLRSVSMAWGLIEERSRLRVGLSKEYIDVCKRFATMCAERGIDHVSAMEQILLSYQEDDETPQTRTIDAAQ